MFKVIQFQGQATDGVTSVSMQDHTYNRYLAVAPSEYSRNQEKLQHKKTQLPKSGKI